MAIDIANPITADYKGLTIGHSTSAAEEIQKLAPGAKVVKAFNTIFAELLPTESRKGRKVQVFIAGDSGADGRDEYSAGLLPGLGHLRSARIPKQLVTPGHHHSTRPRLAQFATGEPNRFGPGVPLRKPSSIRSQIAPILG